MPTTAIVFNLKILFICDDNDLSVLTKTKERRKWKLKKLADSFGINAMDITDDPLTIYHSIKSIQNKFPSLINIRTCREYWHEGAGKDKEDRNFWNRYQIVRKQLLDLKEEKFVLKNEKMYKNNLEKLWEKRLQKL